MMTRAETAARRNVRRERANHVERMRLRETQFTLLLHLSRDFASVILTLTINRVVANHATLTHGMLRLA